MVYPSLEATDNCWVTVATVYKGSRLALFSPMEGLDVFELEDGQQGSAVNHLPLDDTGQRTDAQGEVPPHLQDLLERGAANLDCVERSRLAELLTEFAGAFTGPDGKLGQTELTRHTINTGTATPIRQPPRRLTIHKRQEADRQVKQMLQDGVVEPSHSPWSSPVVLVRKKDGSRRYISTKKVTCIPQP
ncbi:uncharacterized protein LOC119735292 [Patiria miniata]|uniref:Uncharacterized protein n=1 Tax=Patiria miniata TaxID=46514 RepID=A0A914ANA8_PATMI|nr:uncharacterized protein LOC119735292 [Patiria miniata]